jgi:hypothetical protein
MYILQMISKTSSLLSQMFFHVVLLKSHCQNRIQANGTGTATILCNFNTPSLLLVFSVHHISLYIMWNTCSCLCTSSIYGTPHSVQFSCFIHPVPLLPVTIFRHDSILVKSIYYLVTIILLSVCTYQCGSHQTHLHEIWSWRLFIDYVETTQIWLQWGKNFEHSTWSRRYILFLAVTINSHNSALFDRHGIRLLGTNITWTQHSIKLYCYTYTACNVVLMHFIYFKTPWLLLQQ